MRHILILPSWYPANPNDIHGVFFREQALALQKHGHRVGVIHPYLHPLRSWKKIFSYKFGIIQEVDAGLPTLRSFGMNWYSHVPYVHTWHYLWHGQRLYKHYVEHYDRPDLIHVHSMLHAGLLAKSIQVRYGIPFVVTEHYTGYARGALSSKQLQIHKAVARTAKRRLAVSQPFCKLLQSMLGSDAGLWEELPNIVEQRFLDRPLPSPIRSDGKFRFVTVALLDEKKGVHNLIKAFAAAFPNDPQVTLDVGGHGAELERLEALAGELGVASRVQFFGALNRDQVADVIAAADALVLASRYETFGVVIIEALAMGKPVIATRCGGPEGIIRENEGLLVPVDDVGALAHAMEELRRNIVNYNAADIRRGCFERYSEQVVVERLNQIYDEVVESFES